MSLTFAQQEATKKELKESMALVNMTAQDIANALLVDEQVVLNVLELKGKAIESPWILKEFLQEEARNQGKEPIAFTALTGDYHHYWFLNSKIIEQKKIR